MNKIIAIAINNYLDSSIPNLSNCINDINKLIDVLSRRYEYDSIELFNEHEQTTYDFLYTALYNEFINSCQDDSILVLFAGHGEFNSTLGTSYWLCSDSIKNRTTTWFNLSELLRFFSVSPCRNIALISDSCFSGAIFENYRGGGLDAIEGKRSRQAMTSGGIETVSDGEVGKNSPFSLVLEGVLNANQSNNLSFNNLAENTILTFDKNRKQTPRAGSLSNSGHEGGAYFFKLKEVGRHNFIRPLQIPLEINDKIKFESEFEIPFFNENNYFESNYVNVFTQQLGYSIINDIRMFFSDDLDYHIERSNQTGYSIYVGYSIETINDRFLSLVFRRCDYFGGNHDNHRIYTINFALKPTRKITLTDLLDYTGFNTIKEYLLQLAQEYEEEQCRGTLKMVINDYSGYDTFSDLPFSFNSDYFTIYFIDKVPHAIKQCGIMNIPIEKIKFKI